MGEVVYKWFKIGVQLGIQRGKLMEFGELDDPLSAVVDNWLRGNVESVPVSWDSIVTVLKTTHVGEPALAERISRKYCQQGEKGQLILDCVWYSSLSLS